MRQSSSVHLLSSALLVLSLACSGDEDLFPNPPAAQGGTPGAGGAPAGAGGSGGAAAGEAGAGGQNAGAGGDAGSGGSAGEAGGAGGQAGGGDGGNASGAGGDAAGAGGGSSGSGGTPSGVRVPDCEAPAESASGGSCVTLDEFVTCNPVSNAPCKDGETCDFAGAGTTSCFPPPNDAKLCQPCSNNTGPFCAGGHICLDDVCHRYCCTDSDCGPGALCVASVLKASQQEAGAGVCVRYEEEAGGAGGASGASGAAGAGGDFTISPACEGCFGQKCGAEFQACTKDGVCTACATQDPFQPSCETNQPWQNIITCLCTTSDCGTTTCTNECAALAPQGAGGAAGSGAAGQSGQSGQGGGAAGGSAGSGGGAGASAGSGGASAGSAGSGG